MVRRAPGVQLSVRVRSLRVVCTDFVRADIGRPPLGPAL